MHVSSATVREEREWILDRDDATVHLINSVRSDLGEAFDVDVLPVSIDEYRAEVAAVFADGDTAVNAAALCAILRDLDVEGDYPGFVVDEVLGRELASTIAGGRPLSVLAEATFHYADITTHGGADAEAGLDDLDAALAAGFQTRLPGWGWTEGPSPFSIEK